MQLKYMCNKIFIGERNFMASMTKSIVFNGFWYECKLLIS